MRRHLRTRTATVLLAVVGAVWPVPAGVARQAASSRIELDNDDIGGTVTSDSGPEAGVWVIAETSDLATRFTRIVVTDEEGRFVLPDLPRASYEIFVRGYGLLDSKRVSVRPGQRLELTSVVASSEREAAIVYPAAYWLTVMRVPPTGPIHPADLTRTMKRCLACHQLGTKATRELPANLGTVANHLDAWDQRMKRGPDASGMFVPFAGLRGQRTMFSEWTERIAAGAYPLREPPRPQGIERQLVVTLWDWGEPSAVTPNAAASDARNPQVNANGPVYGPSRFHDALLWVNPRTHATGTVRIPTSAAVSDGMASPYFGDERIWRAAAEPADATLAQEGRVWVAARHRPPDQQPAFCTDRTNRFARYFPLRESTRQVSVFNPDTSQFTHIDTCFTANESDVGGDGRLYFGSAGVVGWIETKASATMTRAARVADPAAVQGWCPMVVDTNDDGAITTGWTEPGQPIDPRRDHRIDFACEHPSTAPDGTLWCGPGGVNEDRIVRVEIGTTPPESCRAEIYQVPAWRDVAGASGIAIDRDGVAWVNMAATDHIASFDRRKCKQLNGLDAVGSHCPEGWRFVAIPGPPFSIAAPTAGGDVVLRGALAARTTDYMHSMLVDRFDVLGLNGGRDVPMTLLSNSDAALAFLPETGDFITLRVPYPLGFYGRSLQPRVDDSRGGWKGRGLWSSYASRAGWHVEGGPGVRSKTVKFQLRPTPLAK